MATLYTKGELNLGEDYVHESIIGTTFVARAVETTTVGNLPAVIPEITGRAYVTGLHQFVVDPDDPLKQGFLLGKG